jgi:hypothetical protein
MRILTVNGSALSMGPVRCFARHEPAAGPGHALLAMDYGI